MFLENPPFFEMFKSIRNMLFKEVVDFEEVEIGGKTRVRFNLKMIFEGSYQMKEKALSEVNRTNYVVKLFQL